MVDYVLEQAQANLSSQVSLNGYRQLDGEQAAGG
jgi:hypothetical protein